MATICLLTPGQPSTDPRFAKEADALSERGHAVRAIAFHGREHENRADADLLGTRAWTCTYVGGNRAHRSGWYWATRLRYGVARRAVSRGGSMALPPSWTLSRAQPELERAALRTRADLYIAHNIGALRAAVLAARRWHARVGYDLEDYLPGMRLQASSPSPLDCIVERVEAAYLPHVDYSTAASSGIASAYARQYDIRMPETILNVFPLAERPDTFRAGERDGPLRLYWFSQTVGPERGLEDALQAMGRLRGRAIELHLRGTWQPGYRERFFALAASAGLDPGQIRDHPPAPPGEMVRLASEYDVGLALEQPVSEGRDLCLTNKIFTYMLAGNAIAGTSTSGQRPVLERIGEAAALYDPGDVETLACKLSQWYDGRDALERARRRAWDEATQTYNWDLEKQKFLDIVASVLTAG